VARDEVRRGRFRRDPHPALRRRLEGAHPRAFACRKSADPQGRRDARVGLARDHRVSRRALPAALAARSRRARTRAFHLGGDAFRLCRVARAHEHERAQALSRKGAHERSREGHRAHRRHLGRGQRAVPLRRVHRCRCHVRAGGAALSHLRYRRTQPPLFGGDARTASDARMDRGGRARSRSDPRARPVRVKSYVVGGAVRDELLGLPVQDRAHVVVGSTPEEMERLGFKPVGKDFPVFLHPQTHEEYALARTERKSGRGYKGFTVLASPDVTLEDDLQRRDLTINAMARAEDGTLVDPHGGERDLRAGVLRHVSEAFTEDPVRILRVARFAARFGFAIAPETMTLMRRMVEAGEADALVPERVWQELARGLMERSPSRMIAVLRECGALARVLPEVDESFERPEVPDMLAERLDRSAARGYGVAVRFALLVLDLDVE